MIAVLVNNLSEIVAMGVFGVVGFYFGRRFPKREKRDGATVNLTKG